MNIFERIKKLRKESGLSQQDLANKTGYKTKSAISRIESGNRNLTQGQISIFAKALDVSPEYLMGWENVDYHKIQGVTTNKISNAIPILGQISCFEPILTEDNYKNYFLADDSIDADFIIKAKDDSMINANIHKGDLVFFKSTNIIENASIIAALIDIEPTLKRYIKTNDKCVLQSEDNSYNPIVLENDEIMILGQMVGVYNIRNK